MLSDKKKETVAKAFEMYVDSFLQLSTSPIRSLMIDKGSELRGLDEIMEQHCRKRPCVHRSLTGAPVNIIEGYNAQLQRMGQVYNEAGIVSDYGDVLYLVTNAINNQSRPDRMGYSPVELLQSIRHRGLVPHVCTHLPNERVALVEHSLGSVSVQTKRECQPLEWLAAFLCGLPSAGPGQAGVEHASGGC